MVYLESQFTLPYDDVDILTKKKIIEDSTGLYRYYRIFSFEETVVKLS